MEALTAKLQQTWTSKASDKLVAFALYEDAVTNARVEEFCRRAVRELSPAQLIKRAWLCNELRLPKLRAVAVSEAASADIVVLAIHHCEDLAPEIEAWLKAVLEGASRPSIIFAVFDGTHAGDSSSVRAKLSELTRGTGVELVTFSEEMPEDELV
jgi:hypothetical protein